MDEKVKSRATACVKKVPTCTNIDIKCALEYLHLEVLNPGSLCTDKPERSLSELQLSNYTTPEHN